MLTWRLLKHWAYLNTARDCALHVIPPLISLQPLKHLRFSTIEIDSYISSINFQKTTRRTASPTWRCSVPRSSSCLAFFDTASTSLTKKDDHLSVQKQDLTSMSRGISSSSSSSISPCSLSSLESSSLLRGFSNQKLLATPPKHWNDFKGRNFIDKTGFKTPHPAPAFSAEGAVGTRSESTSFGTIKGSDVLTLLTH